MFSTVWYEVVLPETDSTLDTCTQPQGTNYDSTTATAMSVIAGSSGMLSTIV